MKRSSTKRKRQFANTNTPALGTLGDDSRDYLRETEVRAPGLNTQVDSSITMARITQSVRMRYNPIKGLTPERVVAALDQFRQGFFRQPGQMWEAMESRDYQLQIVAPKRKKSVARHGYDIVTVAEVPEGQKQLAEDQSTFLKNFYDHVSVTTALKPDEEGSMSLLLRQMMDCVGKFYAVHEIVWQPQADGNLTARFIFCPLYWFEGTRGKLRFLDSEFQIYGREMLPGEWLVSVGDGLMEACSVLWLLKYGPLKAWASFLDKFGMPGIHGKTDALKGTAEWNDFIEALQAFSQEYVTATNRGAEISLVETAKSSGNATFGEMVEKMDRAITQLWRGGDLSTQGGKDTAGASLQGDESEILETDDAKLLEETLMMKVSRHALAWKFGPDTPQLAYVKLRTTPRQNISDDVKVDEFLIGCGVEMTAGQLAERYGRDLPEGADSDKLVSAPEPTAKPGQPGDTNAELANDATLVERAAHALHDDISPLVAIVEVIAGEDEATQRRLLDKLQTNRPRITRAIKNASALNRVLAPALLNEFSEALTR